jgi:hypothetical protein
LIKGLCPKFAKDFKNSMITRQIASVKTGKKLEQIPYQRRHTKAK